eukprot:TRINITY_DN4046_c0_g1_i5.p1 TRINITY_DN4046_c0_g1~~TRINITY_DN4046_c0_g1_i5.p1  ORF type:complete len:400 (-),score=71.29 TRINITY_DN4046_c0_g1_i5:119-1318(-)
MEERLPTIPIAVFVRHVAPEAIVKFTDAVAMMTLCKECYKASNEKFFWEPLLQIRFQLLLNYIERAYGKYHVKLKNFLLEKYVFWPESVMKCYSEEIPGGVKAVVKSKLFMTEQVNPREEFAKPFKSASLSSTDSECEKEITNNESQGSENSANSQVSGESENEDNGEEPNSSESSEKPADYYPTSLKEGLEREDWPDLRVLSWYFPHFSGYGSYFCLFRDKPSLMEGWIEKGGIYYGIKYTAWPRDEGNKAGVLHVYEGRFGPDKEGFPYKHGVKTFPSGLCIEGRFKNCTYQGFAHIYLTDGVVLSGKFTKISFMNSACKEGTITWPNGKLLPCEIAFAYTDMGPSIDDVFLLIKMEEKLTYIVKTKNGFLEPCSFWEEPETENAEHSFPSSSSNET